MTEEKEKDTGRKSIFESVPSYLAGFAAVATATVAVLTYLRHQDLETKPITETEISHGDVRAVPSVEVTPARSTSTKGAAAVQASPTLDSALHPTHCPAYLGTWKLSTGELMSLFENDRVEVKAGAAAAPRFGRWTCSGRNDEIFYLTLDRAGTLVFDASGDGAQLYQRADQHGATPLSATRQ
jgi:hypothetical protein